MNKTMFAIAIIIAIVTFYNPRLQVYPLHSSVVTTTFVASNPSINGLADATVYVFAYHVIQ